jgi:DNA replication protein DnaC
MPLNDIEIQYLEERKRAIVGNCQKCKGIGEIPITEGGIIVRLEECDCMKRLKWELIMYDSGIPELYFDVDISNYQGKGQTNFSKVQSYCERIDKAKDKGLGLFFQGGTDSGKSYVAVCVLKEALKRGFTGYYTSLYQMIEKIKASWGNEVVRKANIETLYWCDFLIVEDINRVYKANSDYVDSTFVDIIQQRNLYNRVTIMTLRGAMSDVKEDNKYGTELYSILQSKLIPVTLVESGYRKKKDAYKTLMEE